MADTSVDGHNISTNGLFILFERHQWKHACKFINTSIDLVQQIVVKVNLKKSSSLEKKLILEVSAIV